MNVRILGGLAAIALLAGCGDTTMPWSSGSQPEGAHASLSVTPASLSFSARAGSPRPSAQTLHVSVRGTVYVSVQTAGAAVASVSLSQTSASTGDISVTPADPVSAGTLTGTVSVRACLDQACSRHADGSPAVIPVTYGVRAPTLAVSPASIAVSMFQGGTAPAAVPLTVTDSAGGTYSIAVPVGSSWITPSRTSGNVPDTVSISFLPTGASAGTYTGSVSVTSPGGQLVVPVTLTVNRPAIHATPSSVSFSAVKQQPLLPMPQTVTLTTDGGLSIPYYGTGTTLWNETNTASTSVTVASAGGVDTAPTTVTIGVATTGVALGIYQGTLTLTPTNGSTPVQIPVTYTVTGPSLQLSPSSVGFTATAATTAPDLVTTVAVSDAGTSLVYTTASTMPWLAVGPASGSTQADPELVLSIVVPALAALPNGAHAAEVVVQYTEPSGGPMERRLPVTLDLALPRVRLVAPHTELSGASAEVILRGSGLAGASAVAFDASPASSFVVVSDTEIRATHAALPAGTARVTAGPSAWLGLDLGTTFTVIDPVSLPSAAVSSPSTKNALVYDDVRATVFAASPGVVERYRAASGWARETLALPSVNDIALSPDGSLLLAVASTHLWNIDPDSFTLDPTPATTLTGYWATEPRRLAFANDGRAVLVDAGTAFAETATWDPLTGILFTRPYPNGFYDGAVGAPRDGRQVVLLGSGLSPSQRIETYDAGTGTFIKSSVEMNGTGISMGRDATRVMVTQLYGTPWILDPSYATLGGLAAACDAVLAPDGTRAYTVDASTGRVRVFDLAAAPVAGYFPEIGTAGGIAPAADPGSGVRVALSADGRTLFLAGSLRLVVFPLP
jgi:hypothetical protein